MKDSYQKLLSALIGLARAALNETQTDELHMTLLTGLRATEEADDTSLLRFAQWVNDMKYTIVPNCKNCVHPCDRTSDYTVSDLKAEPKDIRRLKKEILSATIRRARILPEPDTTRMLQGLCAVGEPLGASTLQSWLETFQLQDREVM